MRPGVVYVAPGGRHMGLTGTAAEAVIQLNDAGSVTGDEVEWLALLSGSGYDVTFKNGAGSTITTVDGAEYTQKTLKFRFTGTHYILWDDVARPT